MTAGRDEVRSGSCACGAVRFTVRGPVRDVHYCHCSMCQRASGGTFATLVWVAGADVIWLGAPATYRSSPVARRGFCASCGTPLFLVYDDDPAIAILLGAFDDRDALVPTHHYGVEGRLPWVDIGPDLPAKPTDPELAARVARR